MQDAPPALVPDSEATKRSGMNGTPGNPDAGKSATAESDEQLMVAFTLGSTDAFSELFSRYKQPLFGFFRRRVADPAQAEELTQETFLAVLRASSRYESRALFRTYLYAIGFKTVSYTHLSACAAERWRIPLDAASEGAATRPIGQYRQVVRLRC